MKERNPDKKPMGGTRPANASFVTDANGFIVPGSYRKVEAQEETTETALDELLAFMRALSAYVFGFLALVGFLYVNLTF